MSRCELDHLVVAARTLEAGVAWLRNTLGVTVPAGGVHPLMGTHNRLMRLGDGCFLEIIAIDPDAPSPGRPRWFGLDEPSVRARIAERPALLTWVVRSADIETAVARSPVPLGPVITVWRGDLRWRIVVADDGAMPEGGLYPTPIQWPDDAGPANAMADLGCRLERLVVRHPDPERFGAALTRIGASGLAEVTAADDANPPGLVATIESPQGRIAIS